ncbi:hypothetical protein [Methylobacterium sp. AMS5]|uniref:hypothetical protein n=1 Tax=Methylobacterium sp. AMS5 TaxID=925818 RepID=UPI00074FA1A9|nr:hypothetical protein [Methylobacterium sp. AMS5]AMB48305.1 hypothetical protein Y590_25390 [Methylobacterium sp. AMS5]
MSRDLALPEDVYVVLTTPNGALKVSGAERTAVITAEKALMDLFAKGIRNVHVHVKTRGGARTYARVFAYLTRLRNELQIEWVLRSQGRMPND